MWSVALLVLRLRTTKMFYTLIITVVPLLSVIGLPSLVLGRIFTPLALGTRIVVSIKPFRKDVRRRDRIRSSVVLALKVTHAFPDRACWHAAHTRVHWRSTDRALVLAWWDAQKPPTLQHEGLTLIILLIVRGSGDMHTQKCLIMIATMMRGVQSGPKQTLYTCLVLVGRAGVRWSLSALQPPSPEGSHLSQKCENSSWEGQSTEACLDPNGTTTWS